MDKKLDKFLSEYSNIEFSKVNKNIFEISGFPHYETVFNNVLAFFLDSSESHNFKNIVYKSLLELLKSKSDKIDLYDEETWEVNREESTDNGKLIDILIKSENYIIGIETKINASLTNDIDDYYNHIEKIKENGQKPIFVILSKKSINENRKNIFSITHKEFNSILEKNINSNDNNKYAYLLKDFLDNMNNFYGGSTMNKEFIELLKDEEKAEKIKDIYFNVYEVRKELERNARELKNELNANPKIFKSSRIIKPNWTINICIELSKYFYNECEFVIEIYIGVNDSYEVFIYFRKNSKVLKFDEKLDKFMKDITANFYKNFELSKGEYDELMANLNKEKLFELVKCIEENCSKLKSKNNI